MGCDRDTPWLLKFNINDGVWAVTFCYLTTYVTLRRRRDKNVTFYNRGKPEILTTMALRDP